jgi:hypothetical protein
MPRARDRGMTLGRETRVRSWKNMIADREKGKKGKNVKRDGGDVREGRVR